LSALEAAVADVQLRRSRATTEPYIAQPMARAIRPTLYGALIGRVLGDARERAGLTQRAAAAKLGVSQSSLADIETGRRAVTIEEAYRLIELYGLSLSALDVRTIDPKQALVKRSRGRPRSTGGDFEAAARIKPSELRHEAEKRLRDAEEVFSIGRVDRSFGYVREALAMFVADAGWRVNHLPSPTDSFVEGLQRLEAYREINEIGQIVVLTDLLLLDDEPSLRDLQRVIRLVRAIGQLLEAPGTPTP
jgi:transcriptional regulator with XRE-family HTH domain